MTDPGETAPKPTRRIPVIVLLPVIFFAAVAVLFAIALRHGDPSRLPSTLIGRPAPEVQLPPMQGLRAAGGAVPGFSTADLRSGQPTVVNFFASWCVPCVREHPYLMSLANQHAVRIIGVNYKDPSPGGRRFIGRYGNPYSAVGIDPNGRVAIEWGVYGMPETFVVDGNGKIVFKHVGPLTSEAVTRDILPALARAARAAGSTKATP